MLNHVAVIASIYLDFNEFLVTFAPWFMRRDSFPYIELLGNGVILGFGQMKQKEMSVPFFCLFCKCAYFQPSTQAMDIS